MEFPDFVKKFQEAIRGRDMAFIKKVYSDWFESSGVMPGSSIEDFLKAAYGDLKGMGNSALEGTECFDDFCIARMKDPDGSAYSLTFVKKDGSWSYFNERSNLSKFKRIYAINYVVEGGRLKVLFNNKRSPILEEIGASGVHSMINAALDVGDNVLTILPPESGEAHVTIRISGGRAGQIINSAQGDVLSWEGIVKEPVRLEFRAE
jgi:hypothetical protein